jgi:hypothetical protein
MQYRVAEATSGVIERISILKVKPTKPTALLRPLPCCCYAGHGLVESDVSTGTLFAIDSKPDLLVRVIRTVHPTVFVGNEGVHNLSEGAHRHLNETKCFANIASRYGIQERGIRCIGNAPAIGIAIMNPAINGTVDNKSQRRHLT